MIVVALALCLIGPVGLLLSWIISSPTLSNIISRPNLNPLFGSVRLVDYIDYAAPGFNLIKLLNYDTIVLLFLLCYIVLKGKSRKGISKIDITFIVLCFVIFFSTIRSNSLFHGVRAAIQTFGLYFVSYSIGKNLITGQKRLQSYANAVLTLGVLLVIIGGGERYLYGQSWQEETYRLTGPFAYWETYGITLSIAFYIIWYRQMLTPMERKIRRLAYSGVLFSLIIGIALTKTRTVIVGFIVGVIIAGIVGRKSMGDVFIKKYIPIIILILVTISVFPTLLTNTAFYQTTVSRDTGEERVETYIAAVRMFIRNPILGIGLKNFRDDMKGYISESEAPHGNVRRTLHNSYLVLASETGLPGLIFMIVLICLIFRSCLRYYNLSEGRQDKLWAVIMIGMSITYYASGITFDPFFEATIDNKLYYLSLGIMTGKYLDIEQV